MNKVVYMIWEWRFVILLAAAFIMFSMAEWQRSKAILYALMLQAKRMAKDAVLGSGQEQEEWVVKKAMQFLPLYLRITISEEIVREVVKWLFIKLKDYMDDGSINNSINI